MRNNIFFVFSTYTRVYNLTKWTSASRNHVDYFLKAINDLFNIILKKSSRLTKRLLSYSFRFNQTSSRRTGLASTCLGRCLEGTSLVEPWGKSKLLICLFVGLGWGLLCWSAALICCPVIWFERSISNSFFTPLIVICNKFQLAQPGY